MIYIFFLTRNLFLRRCHGLFQDHNLLYFIIIEIKCALSPKLEYTTPTEKHHITLSMLDENLAYIVRRYKVEVVTSVSYLLVNNS